MLELLVLVVKLAGLGTLGLLAWLAFSFRRAPAAAPEADPAAPRPDADGARVIKGFTLLLWLGAGSMLLLSLIGLAGDL